MEILNREKLREVLEKWKEHPSVTGLMEKFSQLQSYTNKNYKSIEAYTKQKIKESKFIGSKRIMVLDIVETMQLKSQNHLILHLLTLMTYG